MTTARRVLHLVNRLDAGGVLRHVTDLADGLTAHGYESLLAGWAPPGSPLHADDRFLPLPLYGEGGERKSPVGALIAIHRLRRFCAARRVDVVHMHSRYALLLGRYAGTGPRRVYTAHNMFPDVRGRAWYPSVIIAPSRAVAAQLAGQLDRAEGRGMHVIPHGVPLPPAEEEVVQPDAAPVFAWIGRLEEEKGLAHVLEAFAGLGQEGDALPRLEIVGEGSARAAMQRYCRERGMDSRVRFHGWLADPFAALPAVRALLFSSLRLDALGYVNIEAMARGIPVIAADLSVLDDLVIDGVNGRRYPPGDAEALAVLLRDASAAPDRMRALGAAAREHVARHYTLDRMLRETAAVYTALLSA